LSIPSDAGGPGRGQLCLLQVHKSTDLSVPSFFTTFPKRRNLGNYKMERCRYESTLTVNHPALKTSICSQLNGHARAVKVLVDIRFSVF
jgi:hypothetical protein